LTPQNISQEDSASLTPEKPATSPEVEATHHILQNISQEDSASLTPEKPATTPEVEATFQRRPRHLKDNYISPVQSPKRLQTLKNDDDLLGSLSYAGYYLHSP
jgi:hypothetical protein